MPFSLIISFSFTPLIISSPFRHYAAFATLFSLMLLIAACAFRLFAATPPADYSSRYAAAGALAAAGTALFTRYYDIAMLIVFFR
jgi:hypothetical protein